MIPIIALIAAWIDENWYSRNKAETPNKSRCLCGYTEFILQNGKSQFRLDLRLPYFPNLQPPTPEFINVRYIIVRANPSTSTPKKLKECNTIVILFVSKPEDIYSLENMYKLEKDILFSLLLDQVPYAAVSVAVLYDQVNVGDGEPHSQQVFSKL